ncbi:maintenance of telomere capping protein 1 [Gautieria morchelliformis]|nr:maintenance of telomere capping protein 1 [Gautieria morchelliformis]
MSKQQEALQFLDDLDSLNVPSSSKPAAPTTSSGAQPANEAEALAFLDEITQKSSEPTRTTVSAQPRTVTPRTSSRISLRKGADGLSRSASPASVAPGHAHAASASAGSSAGEASKDPSSDSFNAGAGTWGWGSVWSSASAAVKQARSVVDEQVKNLPKNEQAKKWSEGMMEYVKNAQLDKLGQDIKSVGLSTFTDILNVVAPPISEHEVIQVWLSHDMRGYDGVESLVYRALAKVMEQVEGGDLVVNKGDESRPKDVPKGHPERDLGVVDGFDAAFKLAKANIDEMIKNNAEKAPLRNLSSSNPTTYSTVYLRVQPYLTSIPSIPIPTSDESKSPESSASPTHLQFLLHLSSPSHSLTHTTTTQAVPSRWVDAFQQEDAEGKGEVLSWVEDVLVDVLRVGIEVIGQEYVGERMGWGKRPNDTSSRKSATIQSEAEKGVTEETKAET